MSFRKRGRKAKERNCGFGVSKGKKKFGKRENLNKSV